MISSILKKLKNKPKLLGRILYGISCLLHKTLFVKIIINNEEFLKDKNYLFAFWHGKQFMPLMELLKQQTPNCALVSPSRDGSVLETWLKKLGYDIIRGSSRDGNVKSLINMLKKLRKGYSVGFGVDGPIGPIYKVKPGMTYMAQKSNVPIVPLGSAFSKKLIFKKAWDKYELPLPFSKVIYVIGKPIIVAAEDNLEKVNILLEQKLIDINLQAQDYLNAKNIS